MKLLSNVKTKLEDFEKRLLPSQNIWTLLPSQRFLKRGKAINSCIGHFCGIAGHLNFYFYFKLKNQVCTQYILIWKLQMTCWKSPSSWHQPSKVKNARRIHWLALMCVTLGGIYNSLDNKLAESVNGTWMMVTLKYVQDLNLLLHI